MHSRIINILSSFRSRQAINGLVLGTLLTVILNFSRNFFLCRILSVSDYGLFVIANNLIDLFSLIFNLGIANSVIRYSKQKSEEDLNYFLSTIISFSLYIYLIELALLFVFKNQFLNFFIEQENFTFYFFVLVNFPLIGLLKIIFSLYWSHGKFMSRTMVLLIPVILQLAVFGLIFLFNGVLSLEKLSQTVIVANLISVIWYFYKIRFEFDLKIKVHSWTVFIKSVSKIKNEIFFGFWGLLASLGLILINTINQTSIIKVVNSEALAKYSLLLSIGIYLYMPVQMLGNYIQSQYIDLYRENPQHTLVKLAHFNLISSSAFAVIGICAHFILHSVIIMLFGEKYLGFENVFKFIIIGLMFNSSYVIMGSLCPIIEKNRITTFSIITGVCVCLAMNFLVTNRFGVLGAAITYSVTNFFIAVTQLLLLFRNGVKISFIPISLSIIFSFALYIIV